MAQQKEGIVIIQRKYA